MVLFELKVNVKIINVYVYELYGYENYLLYNVNLMGSLE